MKVVPETLGHSRYAITADGYASVVAQLTRAPAGTTVAITPRPEGPRGMTCRMVRHTA